MMYSSSSWEDCRADGANGVPAVLKNHLLPAGIACSCHQRYWLNCFFSSFLGDFSLGLLTPFTSSPILIRNRVVLIKYFPSVQLNIWPVPSSSLLWDNMPSLNPLSQCCISAVNLSVFGTLYLMCVFMCKICILQGQWVQTNITLTGISQWYWMESRLEILCWW